MTAYPTDDTRIKGLAEVIAPADLQAAIPMQEASARLVHETRCAISNILRHRDDRLLVIVGPCSIHDPKAAIDYAQRLAPVIEAHKRDLLIVMRVYFEKPRTTVGWKGLINDPHMNNTYDINLGLRLARQLLVDLARQGIPSGTEYLDPITPQYLGDVVAWSAIGARTTESQIHRQLASGLSCPVGFKNSTEGSVQVAIDAIRSSREAHIFLSVTKQGHCAIFETRGNEDCHVILRGGTGGPNYGADNVEACRALLARHGLPESIMVDCSHGNSEKMHERQVGVAADVAMQVGNGSRAIVGLMLESNLVAGRQDILPGQPLVYGQSVTDACIDWKATEAVLAELAGATRRRRGTTDG
jgi:3-deoxy-7-phosphoheptulonate synthase